MLGPAVSEDAAADVIWPNLDPIFYHRLVGGRGRSAQRFHAWLARSLRSHLLAE